MTKRIPLFLLSLMLSPTITLAEADQAPSPADALKNYLNQPGVDLKQLAKSDLAGRSLSKIEANKLSQQLLTYSVESIRKDRKKEFDDKSITVDGKTLKYAYRTLGKKPEGGHSLYLSMHGGGGAPARVNDGQWSNQIKLYTPKEGIYVAPRAPTDTWDLWHMPHVDTLFDRLIENFIAFEGINPNKVYVLGYSAGGDGTYQLAPRMADRWAGAAMMAGHPGDAQTYNLYNLPYFIQCGGKDGAYKRNQWCKAWGEKLDQLEKDNPGAYPHKWIVYPQYGHWMNLDCKQAIPWMAKNSRNPWPTKVQWYQDNVTHTRFYWLSNPEPKPKQMVTAEVKGQVVTITVPKEGATLDPPTLGEPSKDVFTPLPSITLRLSDRLLDLDRELLVKTASGKELFKGKVTRNLTAIAKSIEQRADSSSVATAELKIILP